MQGWLKTVRGGPSWCLLIVFSFLVAIELWHDLIRVSDNYAQIHVMANFFFFLYFFNRSRFAQNSTRCARICWMLGSIRCRTDIRSSWRDSKRYYHVENRSAGTLSELASMSIVTTFRLKSMVFSFSETIRCPNMLMYLLALIPDYQWSHWPTANSWMPNCAVSFLER